MFEGRQFQRPVGRTQKNILLLLSSLIFIPDRWPAREDGMYLPSLIAGQHYEIVYAFANTSKVLRKQEVCNI